MKWVWETLGRVLNEIPNMGINALGIWASSWICNIGWGWEQSLFAAVLISLVTQDRDRG